MRIIPDDGPAERVDLTYLKVSFPYTPELASVLGMIAHDPSGCVLCQQHDADQREMMAGFARLLDLQFGVPEVKA